jgi:hypothetical protein
MESSATCCGRSITFETTLSAKFFTIFPSGRNTHQLINIYLACILDVISAIAPSIRVAARAPRKIQLALFRLMFVIFLGARPR